MSRPTRWPLFVLVLLAWAAAPRRAPADLVYFKRGGQVQIPTTREGTTIVITLAGRTYRFAPEAIDRIVPGHDPAAEWPDRRDRSRREGAASRFHAAWWAIENGMTVEAVATIDESHRLDPSHPALATFHRTLELVRPPLNDPEPTGRPPGLSDGFRESRSDHFLLFHQLDDREARDRLELLEKVYTAYFLTFAGQGIALSPPSRRLVSVIFARQADYKAFLDREHARAFGSTQGYYHPTRNLVAAFESRDAADTRRAYAALDARRVEVARLEAAIPRMPRGSSLRIEGGPGESKAYSAPSARSKLAELKDDLQRAELLLDTERLATDLGIAAHESIHQLAANTGLAPHHDDFPTWLHEGLAAQFEVVRGGRWAGVGRAHDRRLVDFRSIQPPPRASAIIQGERSRQGYDRDSYAEFWALVYYLKKEHPSEFVAFLDLLRGPESRSIDRKARAAHLFERAFGPDAPSIDRAWLAFLRAVTTPLEDGKRPPGTTSAEIRPRRN